MELMDLLLMSRDLGATDPRDKVYALLGLSNHELQPDYECSAEHIFTKFAMHTIGEATGHGLKISSRTKAARQALILLSCSGYHNNSLVLQSWVPDWTVDLRSRPLMFDPRFRAGGDELELDWSFETGLQLCGKLLDIIGTAGSVHLEDTSSSDARGAIESWWAQARRIANATVMQSPGSTIRMNAFRGLQRDLGLCWHGYYEGEKMPLDGATGPWKPRRKRSLIDEHDLAQDLNDPHDARLTMTLGPTRGRVFFSTTNGYIGLGPSTVLEGDLIYIVLGGSVPYIFRPREDGALTLIGEAYVQGIMSGEALMMDRLNLPHEIHVR
ncbi:hypothetical protein Slin15195_G018040 [Septoria linicola]|uniref:Heterokaryon incompatibility domain-containing protein n=1 Tax=Septoria linicola TaxID=215465 RepID=A0A9Q9AG64_9PEZI|nr:hypothetical protein Slin15195_G018040 [Septoria linicola]